MAFASANSYDLRYVKESVAGTTPTTPTLIPVRNTGESLSKEITTERSQEIRVDRAPADIIPVDASVGGSFDFEMSYGSFDDFIAAGVMKDWQVVNITDTLDINDTPTDNLTSGTANAFQYIQVGQYVRLGGFATSANNRVYKVTGKTSDLVITLSPTPNASESAVAGATVQGDWIKNGATTQTFSMVKRFNDLNPKVTQLFTGMQVGGFSLDMSTASLITGSFDFLGQDAVWGSDPAVAGETNAAGSTTTVMNAVTNITDISIDGTGLCATGSVSNMTFTLDNALRERKGLCRLGNIGVAPGQLGVTISGSQYFSSSADAQKFENSTAFSFSFALEDPEGNSYFFTLPRCKYESYSVNATGLDTDVMAEVEFLALADPTTDAVIIITRIPATP